MTDDKPPVTLTPEARMAYVAVFEAITDGRNRDAAMALRGLDDARLEELAVICGDVRTMAEAMLSVNRGSLGTPAARRIRARADKDAVAEALRRAAVSEEAPDGNVLDEIDEAVAGVTDAHIEGRLRETLRRAGYAASPEAVRDFTAACERVDSDPRERQRIQDIADLTEAGDLIYGQALAALRRGDRDAALPLLRWSDGAGIGESDRLLAVLESVDRAVTPEHVAARFRELLDDAGGEAG